MMTIYSSQSTGPRTQESFAQYEWKNAHPMMPSINASQIAFSKSEIATTDTSTQSPHAPSPSQYTQGNLNESLVSKVGSSGPAEGAIFELLQSRYAKDEDDFAIEDVTMWVNDMELYPMEERRRDLVQVISSVDVFEHGSNCGQRQCPVNRSYRAEHRNTKSNTTTPSKHPSTDRRKGQSKSKASQTSKKESESDASSAPRGASTSPYTYMLACPFVKHNPTRYVLVSNCCTERFGFPTPGKLVEHLKRVHSLRVPCCIICKQRFNGKTRSQAELAQQCHITIGQCQLRELTLLEPEWMTQDQDARFASSIIQGQLSSPAEKWRSIYRQLFDLPEGSVIPDPYYDYLIPSHYSTRIPTSLENGNSSFGTASFTDLQHRNEPASATSRALAHTQEDNTQSFDSIHSSSLNLPTSYSTLNSPMPHSDTNMHAGSSVIDTTFASFPSALLTEEQLDINESAQPKAPFEVYQGQDSGYQSLGQTSGLEIGIPLNLAEPTGDADQSLVHESSETAQVEEGLLWCNDLGLPDHAFALADLKMDQLPENVEFGRR